MGGNYQVGYKRPPQNTRFQKGRSGNPKGRPKKEPTLWSELAEALEEKVSIVVEDKRRIRIRKRQLIVKQLTNKAALGDPRAIALLFKLQRESERSPDGPGTYEHPTADEEIAFFHSLLEEYQPPEAPKSGDSEK
jgi:hypothetical protein